MMARFQILAPGNALRMVLALQFSLAVFLIGADLAGSRPALLSPPIELPTGPVSPGDQRREYRTDRTNPDLLTLEGPTEIPLPEKFSERLEMTELDVEGIGLVLLLSGGIEQGDTERVRNYLDGMIAEPQLVALHSPGGIVFEAQSIGRLLRYEELPTAVLAGAYCLSSCPYVLAGGAVRTVSKRSVVGMHQHYYEQPKLLPAVFAVEEIQYSQGETMEYLLEMGVEPRLMLYSLNTPPEAIYALVEDELLGTGLATKTID